ncbi:MAG: GxxExxY protein [Acidobacteria bacterium]|nr:GxxExxY protein [Acidobacteriota bacterium]
MINTDESSENELLANLFSDASTKLPPSEVTEKIIGCAFKVSNTLGCGFLEKVYENALAYELRKLDFHVAQQQRVDVFYDDVRVGYYDADIVVEGCVIIEVKAVRSLDEAHKAQCLNYLKATGIRLGLLLNFGSPRVEIKRLAL